MRKINIVRLCVFLSIAGIHAVLLFVTFTLKSTEAVLESPTRIMKLADFDEEIPEERPKEIPPKEIPPEEVPPIYQNTVEAIADVMQETDEVLPDVILSLEPIPAPVFQEPTQEQEDYLPMHKISIPPVFSEQELRQRLTYPVIAQKSGIEGIVYLELFVDKYGDVQRILILKEDPRERGFGEAAVKAFQGFHCTPAQANGVPVAVRYRYPLRFAIR